MIHNLNSVFLVRPLTSIIYLYYRRFGTKCTGCCQGILPEDYVRWARNKPYHVSCFKCMECHKELSTGDELYIMNDNWIFCKRGCLSSRHLSEGESLPGSKHHRILPFDSHSHSFANQSSSSDSPRLDRCCPLMCGADYSSSSSFARLDARRK